MFSNPTDVSLLIMTFMYLGKSLERTYKHKQVRIHTHTHTRARTHTYTHTHTYIYIYIRITWTLRKRCLLAVSFSSIPLSRPSDFGSLCYVCVILYVVYRRGEARLVYLSFQVELTYLYGYITLHFWFVNLSTFQCLVYDFRFLAYYYCCNFHYYFLNLLMFSSLPCIIRPSFILSTGHVPYISLSHYILIYIYIYI